MEVHRDVHGGESVAGDADAVAVEVGLEAGGVEGDGFSGPSRRYGHEVLGPTEKDVCWVGEAPEARGTYRC